MNCLVNCESCYWHWLFYHLISLRGFDKPSFHWMVQYVCGTWSGTVWCRETPKDVRISTLLGPEARCLPR